MLLFAEGTAGTNSAGRFGAESALFSAPPPPPDQAYFRRFFFAWRGTVGSS